MYSIVHVCDRVEILLRTVPAWQSRNVVQVEGSYVLRGYRVLVSFSIYKGSIHTAELQ